MDRRSPHPLDKPLAARVQLSDGGRFNEWTIIISDAIFMLLTGVDILLRCVTEGARFWTHPWHYLDALVLLVSILKLCFKQELQRSLTAACSLRILMLLPRFGELRKLSEAILRALPAMLVTFAATSIVWVIFAILAVNMYGGMFWQCVALADAAGVPGCGVPLAANSSSEFDTSGVFSRYTDPIGCRYAPAPLAVPHGVVPGATTSAQCGCTFEEQKVTYGGERIEISVNARVGCAPTTIDGVEVAWLPGYPNFDNFGKAFVALFQISTLDGWSNLMYFAMDVTALETQPHRESELWSPILYFFVFIIFGVLFITNIFVGVVIDEFQKIKREYDGSAFLTDEQASWVYDEPPIWHMPMRQCLGRLLLRVAPEQAYDVYAADLRQFPANGYSLWGLRQSMALQPAKYSKAEVHRVEQQMAVAWASADGPLNTSCAAFDPASGSAGGGTA